MDSNKQQLMREMIERAAQEQEKNLAWVGNLYRKRLKDLQDTEEKRQAWLKEQHENPNELA